MLHWHSSGLAIAELERDALHRETSRQMGQAQERLNHLKPPTNPKAPPVLSQRGFFVYPPKPKGDHRPLCWFCL